MPGRGALARLRPKITVHCLCLWLLHRLLASQMICRQVDPQAAERNAFCKSYTDIQGCIRVIGEPIVEDKCNRPTEALLHQLWRGAHISDYS